MCLNSFHPSCKFQGKKTFFHYFPLNLLHMDQLNTSMKVLLRGDKRPVLLIWPFRDQQHNLNLPMAFYEDIHFNILQKPQNRRA